MAKLFNLARVSTATTGTGTITLGAAVSGYLTFALAGVSNGEVVSYGIKDGANSEVGTGTYTSAGTTLTRTVTKSTNSDAAISLSGSAEVFITPRKEDLANLGEANTFTAAATFTDTGSLAVPVIVESTDAGAVVSPILRVFRNSASPAAADEIGKLQLLGKDSGGNNTEYGVIGATIDDPADGSEDGTLYFSTPVAGTVAKRLKLTNGLYTVSGTDKGADTINGHSGLYDAGFRIGAVKLAEGTASAAATIDIVMTAWTAYRHISIILDELIPATDGSALWCRFSTDGGSSYDATGYNYAFRSLTDADVNATAASASANQIVVTLGGAATAIGNGATEGIGVEVHLYGRTNTALWSRVTWFGYYINSAATPAGVHTNGGGAREAAQDIDAIRILMSSGNLSGKYTVYGWL